MKRGKYLLLALCVLLLLSLCSCGKKAVKTEEEMLADYMDATAEKFTDAVVTIDSRKTDTDNKTDEVYIVICTNDGVKEMKRTVCMGYHLYDDGWQLDGYTVVGESFKPLKEPEIIEADIAEKVSAKYGGTTEQVSVGEVSGSLEDGKYSGKVTCLNVHKYMNEAFTFKAEWKFDVSLGVWSLYLYQISCEEDWNKLNGWYYDESGDPDYMVSSKGIESFTVSGSSAVLKTVYYSGRGGYEQEATLKLTPIPRTNLSNFLYNYHVKPSGDLLYCLASGYTAQALDTQLTDFEWYCATDYPDRYWLIGKDHIAQCAYYVSSTPSSKRVTCRFPELSFTPTNHDGITID